MRALVYTRYGPPDVLNFKERDTPHPEKGEVMVRVVATTVNRTDCATIRAKPFFARFWTGLLAPSRQIPGTEFSGIVETLGEGVDAFRPGERVFGFDSNGARAHAELLSIQTELVRTIPEGTDYEQAAAGTEGAHYALNFINKVSLESGMRVLVNGATGAIGSAMVQLLAWRGVKVTAVCATPHLELVRSLGAKRVIDYTRESFTDETACYDFVFDTVGKSSFFQCFSILKPGGAYISSDLGFAWQNIFLPLVTSFIKPLLGGKHCLSPFPDDIPATLDLLHKLRSDGAFTAPIDSTYPFEQIVDAYRYVELGHKTGSVVVTVSEENA